MIFQKTCQVLAPSSRADSSSSEGSDRMKAMYSSEKKEIPPTMCRIVTPTGLSMPSRAVCRMSGRMITGNGMNNADSR